MNEVTRTDAFSFYSLAAISFLESAVPNYVQNLLPFFSDNPGIAGWLRSVWLQEETHHGHLTKRYVCQHWPKFDWEGGYAVFLAYYKPQCDYKLLRPSPALEALARCVTETETAMIYRCIATYTPDTELQALMTSMSKDEVRHYAYFRDVFDRYDARERNTLWRKARTVLARSSLIKEEDIALAFRPLNSCWLGKKPFHSLSYAQYLTVAGKVMNKYFPFEVAKRMLFRPLRSGRWLENFVIDMLAGIVRRQYAGGV